MKYSTKNLGLFTTLFDVRPTTLALGDTSNHALDRPQLVFGAYAQWVGHTNKQRNKQTGGGTVEKGRWGKGRKGVGVVGV